MTRTPTPRKPRTRRTPVPPAPPIIPVITPYGRGPIGTPPPYGRPAWERAPATHGAFNPDYICLLHIAFGPNWALSVNHASFRETLTEPRRLARAVQIFEAKLARPGGGAYEFRDAAMSGFNPFPWRETYHQAGRTNDSTTFADFRFKNRTEIFIFLEHPQLTLPDKEAMIVPTQYAEDGTTQMDENYSFFHAREVTAAADLRSLAGKGKLIRLENYSALADGTPTHGPGRAPQNYSLNIAFKLPSMAGVPVTLIIDPDTGNGMGYEP